MRWDFSATKGLLHLLAQKEFARQDQEQQRALAEQERKEIAKLWMTGVQQMKETYVPPNVGKMPVPFSMTLPGGVTPEVQGEMASRGMTSEFQKATQPEEELKTVGGDLYAIPQRGGKYGVPRLVQPDETTKQAGDKLPAGFAQLTDPGRKAEVWNETYGTNYSAKDFENIQERPYYNAIQDRDGKLRIFDTRTGKFAPETGSDVVKAPPTEIKLFIANLNDNLNSVKEIKKITNVGDVTGVVKGRARKFGTKFFSDTEAETLKRRLGQLRTIIYGLSGKQINESEQTWLQEEIIPQMQQPTENFEVALNEFEAWVKRKKGTIKQQFPNIRDIDEKPADNKGKSLKDKYGLE